MRSWWIWTAALALTATVAASDDTVADDDDPAEAAVAQARLERRQRAAAYAYRQRPAYDYGSSGRGYYGSRYGRGYEYGGYSYGAYGYETGSSYGHGFFDDGAVCVRVQPKEARVFVDGEYFGTAGDFDGTLQHLYLPAGRHQIRLELEGHRDWTTLVYASGRYTLNVRHEMKRSSPVKRPLETARPPAP